MLRRGVWLLVPIVVVAGVVASGVVVVAPGEVAVVRRLGVVRPSPWRPGPHLAWPLGLDRVERVQLDRVRRIEVGLAGLPGVGDEPGGGEFLTGDRNLVRARAVVQYRVADPVAFTIQGAAAEAVLARSAEAALARALAGGPIDRAIGRGRADVARDAAETLARVTRAQGLGVSILGVSLTDARPPVEVEPDFAAAQSARSDRDRRLNEAKAQADRTGLAAKARADALVARASAESRRDRDLARARAERFVALLAEANRSRRLTVRRLYLDALRELLPRVGRKVLMTPGEPVDLSIFGAGQE
jgi:membrane protease subunit HflK